MVMTELDPKFTFDTFVVGPANRLASAAARRSADSPGTSYNPLFIYSSSGLGKSHILHAVAHQARKGNARLRVHYETLEGYLQELAQALETGTRDAMRDRYRDLDILLLDDVQFLAGQNEAQEMLLVTLDALTGSGSQIVLASDRPPADINGLDARLVSCFSGGLIVDIGAPEYETRVAIIRRKAEEQGTALAPGVAETLARFPARNVRELGGVLNRVLAVQDLEGRTVSPEEVAKLIGQTPATPAAPADEFTSFMSELSQTVATTVEAQEEPWRKGCRKAIEAAEREGFSAARIRTLMEDGRSEGWEAALASFQQGLGRLREIERELDQLGNPWPEAAQGVLRDPDRLQEALDYFERMPEDARNSYSVLRNRALALEYMGSLPEALAALERAEQLRSGDPSLALARGIVRLKTGDVASALEELRAYRTSPNLKKPSALYYVYCGLAAALAGELEYAVQVGREGLTHYPACGPLLVNAGAVLERRGEVDAAEAHYARAVQTQPIPAQAHKNLGDQAWAHGDQQNARVHYEKAVTLEPRLGDDIYLRLGTIAYKDQDLDVARLLWRRALELNPHNNLVRTNLESLQG